MIEAYYEGKGITLYCGDAMNVLPEIKQKFDCCITDPPYFVLPNGKVSDDFNWDCFVNKEDFLQFTKKWIHKVGSKLNKRSCKFVFWSQKYLNDGIKIFNPSRLCFWHHQNLRKLGQIGDFAYDYEPLFVIWNSKPMLCTDASSCFFNFPKPQSNYCGEKKLYHPAQKPIGLMTQLLSILDSVQTIIDPFAGSGTTGVACAKLGKKCVLIEKEKKYCDIAASRIENIQFEQMFLF